MEERGVDNSGEARINIIEDKAVSQPGEVEGEVDGAADGDGAEEVVEDVSLLAGKHQAKLALLEAVHLQHSHLHPTTIHLSGCFMGGSLGGKVLWVRRVNLR